MIVIPVLHNVKSEFRSNAYYWLQEEVRNTVAVFYDKANEIWNEEEPDHEYFTQRYVGAHHGVFINLPGDRNPYQYDHTKRGW